MKEKIKRITSFVGWGKPKRAHEAQIESETKRIVALHRRNKPLSYENFLSLAFSVPSESLDRVPFLSLAKRLNEDGALVSFIASSDAARKPRYHELLAIIGGLPPSQVREHAIQAVRLSGGKPKLLNRRIRKELRATSFNKIGFGMARIRLPEDFERKGIKRVLVAAELGADLRILEKSLPAHLDVTLVANDQDLLKGGAGKALAEYFPLLAVKGNGLGDFETHSPLDLRICDDVKRLSTEIVDDFLQIMTGHGAPESFMKHRQAIQVRLEDRLYPGFRNCAVTEKAMRGDYDAYFIIHATGSVFSEIAEFFGRKRKPVYACTAAASAGTRLGFIKNVLKHKPRDIDKFKLYRNLAKQREAAPQEQESRAGLGFAAFREIIDAKPMPVGPVSVFALATSRRYLQSGMELIKRASDIGGVYGIMPVSSASVKQQAEAEIEKLDKETRIRSTFYFDDYICTNAEMQGWARWGFDLFDKYAQRIVRKNIKEKYGLFFVGPTYQVIEQFLIREVPKFLEYHYFLEKLFNENPVRFVVVLPGRDPKIKMAMTKAQENGVKVIDVQIFLFSNHPRYLPTPADKMCVIDEETRNLYIDHFKTPPERVYKAGSIPIDANMLKLLGYDREAIRGALRIGRDKRVIAFATQPWNYPLLKRVFRIMLDEYRSRDDVQIIVKYHPSDTAGFKQDLTEIARAEGAAVVFNSDRDIFEIIRVSDAFVTFFSNVGLEAAISGLPVVAVNIEGDDMPVKLEEIGVAVEARDEASFRQLLRDLTDEEGRRRITAMQEGHRAREPQLYTQDTAKRIIDLACEISKPKPKTRIVKVKTKVSRAKPSVGVKNAMRFVKKARRA
jgi:glycosyltransferase involved in cell wall biosynthesis